jgi:hypothetical protein
MVTLIGPLISFIVGILVIIFRKKIGLYIQKSYESFPQYKDGVQTFKMQFSVKPVYIIVVGTIICLFSFISLIASLIEG